MLFEVCVDSVEGALAAQQGGAQRVELCAGLVEGGVTPSMGMLRMARRAVALALHVLIRPRGGDFCYSPLEWEVMCQDVLAARDEGADGLVLGVLLPDGRVDIPRTRALIELAHPLPVTFHRAIDLSRDSSEALEDIVMAGATRVLTSGREPTVLEGAVCIAGLVRQAAGRIQVMAGGGVNAGNLPDLLKRTGVEEVHFSARRTLESPMTFRVPGCYMGKAYQPDEYVLRVTGPDLVAGVIASAINGARHSPNVL